jgi:hypothetical protein
MSEFKTAKEFAKELGKTERCFCDLDNWEPELSTGHSWVCPIHEKALALAAAETLRARQFLNSVNI